MAKSGKRKSWYKSIAERRIPQVLGFYMGVSWGIIQFVEWLSRKYLLSPHLPEVAFVTLLSMIPTVILLAYYHGTPGKNNWTRVEKLGIPINLCLTLTLLVVLFQGKDLGAMSESVTVMTEDGRRIQRVIPKSEYRKKVAAFFFQNRSGTPDIDWLKFGFPNLILYDLDQDPYFTTADGYEFVTETEKAGFGGGVYVPLALQFKLAKESHFNYLITGRYVFENGEYILNTVLYKTRQGKKIAEHEFRNRDVFSIMDAVSLQIKKDLEIPESHIEEATDLPVAELFTFSVDASKTFFKGMNAWKFHTNPDEAIGHLRKSIEVDEIFALSYLYLFILYANNNQADLMQEPLARCNQYLFKLPEALQFNVKAMNYLLEGDSEKRLAVLKMWSELYPENTSPVRELAEYYNQQGRFELAVSYYRKVLELDPADHRRYLQIGNIYLQAGETEKSLEYYQYYLRRYPENALGIRKVATVYEQRGELQEANKYYEKARILEPDNPGVLLDLGDIQKRLGNLDRALAYYQDALAQSKIGEDSTTAFKRLEKYYESLGQLSKAYEVMQNRWIVENSYRRALNRDLNRIFDMELYCRLGRVEEAREIIENMKMIAPFDKAKAMGHLLIAVTTKNLEGIEQWIPVVEKLAKDANLGFAQGFVNVTRGQVAMQRGDYKGAITEFNKFLAFNPLNTSVEIMVVECHSELKQFSEGRRKIKDVLVRAPASPLVKFHSAALEAAAGNKQKAIHLLTEVLTTWENADDIFEPATRAKALLKSLDPNQIAFKDKND